MRPRLLDLFCCEGGAAAGYERAGFEVVGVDVDGARSRHYPFEFHAGDALEFLTQHGHEFDAVHASPPCQAYSVTRHTHSIEHPDLVAPTRDVLAHPEVLRPGTPWILENVPGAPLNHPVTLCGAAFGLTAEDVDGSRLVLRRHRLFESNVWLTPVECACLIYKDRGYTIGGVYGGGSQNRAHARDVRHGGYTPTKPVMAELIGAPWMTVHGLSQSIPPAYTQYLGEQLLEHLTAVL